MTPEMSAVAELYKFDNSLFLEKVASIENEMTTKRFSENGNPVIWLAGHIAGVRYHLLDLLGKKTEFPWPKLFQQPFDASSPYPKMSEIKDAWTKVSDSFIDGMNKASEETLSKPLEYKLPHNANTVGGALIFFAYHEAWHLGQISFIRKGLDLDGLVPY